MLGFSAVISMHIDKWRSNPEFGQEIHHWMSNYRSHTHLRISLVLHASCRWAIIIKQSFSPSFVPLHCNQSTLVWSTTHTQQTHSYNNQYVVTPFSVHSSSHYSTLYWFLRDVAEDQIPQDDRVSQETWWHGSSMIQNIISSLRQDLNRLPQCSSSTTAGVTIKLTVQHYAGFKLESL